ncbi:Virulence factor protein [Candidatus Nitromaritima sp. SCGC AAA799-C22]|nr:Virulence factor protein [Candidatus Nitromaritima sp. SCGC AAA799-C22]
MENNQKVGQAAGAVSGMTLMSRLFGFLRDLVIAMQFGASAAADAFFVAFRIPNVQRRILGEGAVTAAFIPVFSEKRAQDGDLEAWRMTANLFNILLSVLITSSFVLAVFAPVVILVFAPGFLDDPAKFDLTVLLTRWMAPYLLFIGLSVFCMGILNTYKVFALPAATPALLNICMITAALLISPRMDEPILGLAFGVLAGGLLQFVCQVPAVLRQGFKLIPFIRWKDADVIKIGKLMVPAILGLAVYELNMLVDTLLASLLPEGSISYLYYGNRLVQLPLGVFGVALGVAILPMLSDQAARKELPEMIKTLGFGIRLILFITIPATVGLILLRFPIVNTLWERGEFFRATTEGTAIALLYYSVGLCAFCGIKVIVPAFYSLQDTKTPAKIGIYSMILNIVLNLILMGPLKHGGLALATSFAALFNVVLLIHYLRKRLGLMGGRKILISTLKLVFASGVMGLAVYFFNAAFFDPGAAIGIKVLMLSADIGIGVLTYGILSRLIQNEELTFILDLARKRRQQSAS